MTNERRACATSVLIPPDDFPLINSFGLCEMHNKESTQHVRQTDKDINIIVLFVRRGNCPYEGAFFPLKQSASDKPVSHCMAEASLKCKRRCLLHILLSRQYVERNKRC